MRCLGYVPLVLALTLGCSAAEGSDPTLGEVGSNETLPPTLSNEDSAATAELSAGDFVGAQADIAARELSIKSLNETGYTATKYPIVLLHGLLGFHKILGILDYYPGIVEALEEDGARAFIVTASQANTSEARGEQIIPQLERIRAATGAVRLNLIGHSQGAMDARYIAAVRPDLVASVTGVGGPHKGSKVADFVMRIPLGTEALFGLSELLRLVSGSSYPNDGRAAMKTLSSAGASEFNSRYPAGVPLTACGSGDPVVGGIRFYSWSSVGGMTNIADLFDPLFALTGSMIRSPNDGLVEKCSAHFGEVLRDDYLGNHLDQTNLMAGLVSPFGPNPKTLFRLHANRLKNVGL